MELPTGPKPRSHIFGYLDETGLLHKPDTDRFFGMGLLIVQNPRQLHRGVIRLKDQRRFHKEFKFNHVNSDTLLTYKKLIDIIFDTHGLRFNCYVVDKTARTSEHYVRSYNGYAGYLVANAIDQTGSGDSEYITVLADDVSTNSINDKFESMVRDRVRKVTRRNALFGICRLESHAVTELQVCDVLVGAVAYAHKMGVGSVSTRGAKAQLVKYVQSKLNVFSLSQKLELHLRNGVMFCVTQKVKPGTKKFQDNKKG
ncbi:MAG TPA: DUF3800 domain-containing protein [Candidatus Saccharimonadales bacterium]|nr:DUF3800 domain-containing protein [Candidatus Saccharimonadales bacterium]